jgi:hypothetical protein
VKAITHSLLALALIAGQPLAAQGDSSVGTVFALIDSNEWCPGGSVHVDLETGSFVLYPRIARIDCYNPDARARVERGELSANDLRRLRSDSRKAQRQGLTREPCEMMMSNGGREALVITGPAFSDMTPEKEGCWSDAAVALHKTLFELFGEQRQADD